MVNIAGEWANTWNDEMYLLHVDIPLGIVVISTDTDLRHLCRSLTIYVDGTFKTAPHPFVQFFAVHVDRNGHVLKFACGLLTSKTEVAYRRVFEVLKVRIFTITGVQFTPGACITDFEIAIIKPLRMEFPGVDIFGCYFHFCKALWSHIQEVGLVALYRNNRRIKKTLKYIMALAFLPLPFVRIYYQNIPNHHRTVAMVTTSCFARLFRLFRRHLASCEWSISAEYLERA